MINQIAIVRAVAWKELLDHLRSGWIVAVSIAFGIFAFLIAFAGLGFAGETGVQSDPQVTMLSLVSLVVYLVPLLSLLLAYEGIAGEHERGTLDLLRSYPFSTGLLVVGKSIGYWGVLVLVLLIGLLFPALLAVVAGQSVWSWLVLFACSVGVGVVFASLALMLSVFVMDRARLIAINLVLWLLLVVLFDVGLIGLVVYTGGDLPANTLSYLFFLNPASLFRLLAIDLLVDETGLSQLGLAGQTPSPPFMMIALLLWAVIPLVIASREINRLHRR